MIELESVTKRFGPVTAVDDLTLRIGAGRIVGLLGENGCGKTTLLRMLAGLNQPDRGTIRIAGYAPGARTKAIVSYLPDTPNLPTRARVSALVRYMRDFFRDFSPKICARLLAELGITGDPKLSELSRGQREKVAVALVIARQADIYLLDEPISGVDPAARQATLQAIVGALRPGSLVLLATHLIADVEPLLDEAILMRRGRALSAGAVDALRASHGQSLNDHFLEVYRA